MAFHATHIPAQGHANGTGILSALSGFFASVQKALVMSSGMDQRMAKVEQLQAKSDADLARMGLRRDQIVAHVFRDLFYA